jgi:hypothetical protein
MCARNGEAPFWRNSTTPDRESCHRPAGRFSQPRLNFGVRSIGLEGFAADVCFAGDPEGATGVSVSNTALQPSLRESRCRSMQAVIRATLGISELHSRMASPEHICSCSSV